MTNSWQWDPSLYRGSADYYAVGRLPYPPTMVAAIRDALALDGSGTYLDIGCGPGSLTLLLAPMFEHVIGIDADAGMIRVADKMAKRQRVTKVTWRCMRAEELPADLRKVRLVTFAQSFHWFDKSLVASTVRQMLQPGGSVVHVGATTHQGIEGSTPPREEIARLVAAYLGSNRRAGQGTIPTPGIPVDEEAIFSAAGFTGPEMIEVERGELIERTEDQIVASVFSLSSAAPHLFGKQLPEFERDLRALLRRTSATGTFTERARDITLSIWR